MIASHIFTTEKVVTKLKKYEKKITINNGLLKNESFRFLLFVLSYCY